MKIKDVNVNFTSDASSIIGSIGWEAVDSKIGTLLVTFKTTNATYKFVNVPFKIFTDFAQAKSLGSYFNVNIKLEYEFTKETI